MEKIEIKSIPNRGNSSRPGAGGVDRQSNQQPSRGSSKRPK